MRWDLLIIAPQLLHPGNNSYNKSNLKIFQEGHIAGNVNEHYRILSGKNNGIISNNSHIFFRSENHSDILSPK